MPFANLIEHWCSCSSSAYLDLSTLKTVNFQNFQQTLTKLYCETEAGREEIYIFFITFLSVLLLIKPFSWDSHYQYHWYEKCTNMIYYNGEWNIHKCNQTECLEDYKICNYTLMDASIFSPLCHWQVFQWHLLVFTWDVNNIKGEKRPMFNASSCSQ